MAQGCGCGGTFLTSNFFLSLLDSLATALPLEELAAEESFISTSAIASAVSRWMYLIEGGGNKQVVGRGMGE